MEYFQFWYGVVVGGFCIGWAVYQFAYMRGYKKAYGDAGEEVDKIIKELINKGAKKCSDSNDAA